MAREISYEDLQRANALIQTTDVKGKEYAEVPQRVKAFRSLYPQGTISTEIVMIENGLCVIKATAAANGVVLGEGTAYEKEGSSFITKTSYIENCETSAVGRALGFAGFGIDASIASAEEVMNAQKQQHLMEEDELKAELKKLLQDTESDVKAFLEWCTAKFERPIKAVDEMYDRELKEAIKTVKRKAKK
jgi:hypothetical protein